VSRLATVLAAVVGAAAMLLLAIWQVPQWLDWARYRTTIEVLASATLGQPVTIHGPISLTLLPQTVLTAEQVKVGGGEPNALSIHVQSLRLRIALMPLLGGHVDARELVLHGPDLRIPFPSQSGTLRLRPPSWLAAFAARIEDGRLMVGQLVFTGIDATLATLDTGALSASGTAQFSGQSWHFTTRLTAAGADGAAGLDATLDGEGKANGLGARFTGQIASDGTLGGSIASRGPNLALLLPTPAVPFRADGRLTVGSGLVAFDNLALELGGSPATGAVALRVAPNQRLDIALSASRLDFDAWLPVLLKAGTTIGGFNLPIGIDFSAESAPLGGGTLQHVRAAFDLIGGNLIVRDASARLPGNGTLQLNGRVARDDPTAAQFEGDVAIAAPVLRTTLGWLNAAMPRLLPAGFASMLPNDAAQRATLAAHIVAGNGNIELRHLIGTLDDAPVTGSLELKQGEPPTLTANLTFDRLVLDPWLPARLPAAGALSKPVAALDAALQLNIRQASLRGWPIDGFVVNTAIEGGSVRLRRMEGTTHGLHVIASGTLGAGGKLMNGRFAVETADATPLADIVPTAWRATPALWQGPAELAVQASGPPNALVVTAKLALADALSDTTATIDLASGNWQGTVTLRHPGARRFVASLGLPEDMNLAELPAWLGDGSLSLIAHLVGAPNRVTASAFDLTAAALHVTGDVAFDGAAAQPRFGGHIHADALPLPLPNGMASQPLPLDALRGWRGDFHLAVDHLSLGQSTELHDASASLVVADGGLRLQQFSARLGSGVVTGTLAFDAAATPPAFKLQGQVSGANISGVPGGAPIDLLAGRADASWQISANGYSPSTMLATLNGRVALTIADGSVSGFDMLRLQQAAKQADPTSAEAAANDALQSGVTSFDRLRLAGNLSHGDLVLDEGLMTGTSGEGHVAGELNLVTQALDVRIGLRPMLPNPPDIAIRFAGSLDRPDRAVELSGLARWMAELVH
jgi:hypothetical protein